MYEVRVLNGLADLVEPEDVDPGVVKVTRLDRVTVQHDVVALGQGTPTNKALAWTVARQAGNANPLLQRPGLGQLQYHNHQDDDHQHPDNDANDASVHFASVKFPWSATLPVRSCISEASGDCRGPWIQSSNA